MQENRFEERRGQAWPEGRWRSRPERNNLTGRKKKLVIREQYNDIFLRELERLNEEQRQAVNHIDGPMLVLAGPGTGKTQVLAARIGNILLQTDAAPHNILCLTFTEAGVQAMRQRLVRLIGPEGHRVHVFTFHSFCNSVIQENLAYFGQQELLPVGDLERLELLRNLLEKLPPEHPLRAKRTSVWHYEAQVKHLFDLMKRERWTEAHIRQAVGQYMDSLPDRKEFRYQINAAGYRKGDLKKQALETEKQRMELLQAGAGCFETYRAALAQAQRYDFSDMILMVLEAWERHPFLLARYQEQYLYILVDEYQDTNGAQNEVLMRLVDYWDSPNVFLVGDDDQSIFEFQGARLQNLTDFYEKYRDTLQLVVLRKNYRSSQEILDRSARLISDNRERVVSRLEGMGISKQLEAQHPEFARYRAGLVCRRYASRLQEDTDIAAQISRFQAEGFPLDEVAVIVARHKQLERLASILGKMGIPYRTRREMNILDLPLIRNLRDMLSYFEAEFRQPFSGESQLFRMLHLDFIGMAPLDLARMSARRQMTDRHGRYWRELLADKDFLSACGLSAPEAVHRFVEWSEELHLVYASLPVPVLLERIINRSGLLRQILESGDRDRLAAILYRFTGFVQQESDRRPRLEPGELLELLKSMDANRLAIELGVEDQWGGGSAADGRPVRQVQLLTVHSAKGLEFQRVFLPDCSKKRWDPVTQNSSFQFTFPDTLTGSTGEDALEARRRLLYVAMTRAKEFLQLSYATMDDNGRTQEKAQVLGNWEEHEWQEGPAGPGQAALVSHPVLLAEPQEFGQTQAYWLEPLLERWSISPSALNQYLRCPLSFYYQHLLKIPTLPSTAGAYGLAVHGALARGFGEKLRGGSEGAFPGPEQFGEFFVREMYRRRSQFERREFDARLSSGKQRIEGYVRSEMKAWPATCLVEQRYARVMVDDVPMTGVIDRVDQLPGLQTHLLDYKSGAKEYIRKQSAKPSGQLPAGGDYWRQMHFYKILYDHAGTHGRTAVSWEISCTDPDRDGRYHRIRSAFRPEDVQLVRTLVRETYQEIRGRRTFAGCGQPDCTWCGFLQHRSVDSLTDTAVEALDDQ
ncbi:MAG: hypothetical protein RLY31_2342 [Bacteroidota bacterium]